MHQIDLEVSRLALIPGTLAHGNATGEAIGLLRAAPGQPGGILAEAGEAALHTGDTDGAELGQQRLAERHFTVLEEQERGRGRAGLKRSAQI